MLKGRIEPFVRPPLAKVGRLIALWTLYVFVVNVVISSTNGTAEFLRSFREDTLLYGIVALFSIYFAVLAMHIKTKSAEHTKALNGSMFAAIVLVNILLCLSLGLDAFRADTHPLVAIVFFVYCIWQVFSLRKTLVTASTVQYVESDYSYRWIFGLFMVAFVSTALLEYATDFSFATRTLCVLSAGTLLLEWKKPVKDVPIT